MLWEIVFVRYRVCALVEERDLNLTCPVLDFLKEQNPTVPGHVKGMKTFFNRFAEGGRAKFTTDILHHASQEEDILQLIKGQIRIFCFIDGNTLILTHGALKKTQRADPSEVREAIRCKNEYFQKKGKPL